MGGYVAYLRVSTTRQGQSGLGLEAQQATVQRYLATVGGALLESFQEIESAYRRKKRPALEQALAACLKHGATLLVARLDRLARRSHAVTTIMESKVPFIDCDSPNDGPFIIQVKAAVAEEESRKISQRTKAALQVAKSRGVQLGTHGKVLAAKNRDAADDHAKTIAAAVRSLQQHHRTLRDLTAAMNADQVPTPKGGDWHLPGVHRLVHRLERLGL